MVGKCARPGDGLAQVARAEQRDVVLTRRAQDLADLRDERIDVVAHAPLAELAEAREVTPDLRGIHIGVLGDGLARDGGLPHPLRLREHLQVPGEPCCDSECELFCHVIPFTACIRTLQTSP